MARSFNPDLNYTLPDALQRYWTLNEPSGNRADLVGTYALTDNATVTAVIGKVNSAAVFTSGNSEYLSGVQDASVQPSDHNFMIAGWFYLVGTGASQAFVSKWDNTLTSLREYWLGWTGAGAPGFIFQVEKGILSDAEVYASTFGPPTAATWYFIAAYFNAAGQSIGISVNGGPFNTAAIATSNINTSSATEFRLGGRASGDNFLDGRIDEVYIAHRVPTQQEVTDLYNASLANTYATVPWISVHDTVVGG